MKPLPVLLPILGLLLVLSGCDDAGTRGAPGSAVDTADPPAADAEPAERPRGSAEGGNRAALRSVCDTLTNSFECARAIEERQLSRAADVARRGDTLRLVLAGGDTARLVDEGEQADVRRYSYQDRWTDPGYFLLQLQFYEGSAYLLIDDSTGERTRLPDWPLRSPDGRRFAVLSLDLEAGYVPNTLQVWAFEDGRPELEWETEPDAWGPAEGEWVDVTTLRFTQRGYCNELGVMEGERGLCNRPARLTLEEGSWRLESSS